MHNMLFLFLARERERERKKEIKLIFYIQYLGFFVVVHLVGFLFSFFFNLHKIHFKLDNKNKNSREQNAN